MSVPVILSIVLNMQTALQAITASAGYFNTIKPTSVVLDAVALMSVSPTELPYIVLGHRVEPIERSFATSRPVAIQDRWRITLEARIDQPGTGSARKLTVLSQLEADIEKALTVDPQRGGLALYTYVQQGTRYTGLPDQDMTYLEIPVEVLLQRAYGQP